VQGKKANFNPKQGESWLYGKKVFILLFLRSGMRATEIGRIIAISIIGALCIFFVQPWLYQSGSFFLSDVDPEQWIANAYIPASSLVFGVTLGATCLWYGLSLKASPQRSKDTATWRTLWWVILLGPIVSAGLALYLCRDSDDAFISLVFMYIFDILLMYWITTASSSPGHTKHLPPGSFALRQLFEPR
jgi:hypothetical protein